MEKPPDLREHFRAVFEATPECVQLVASDGTLLDMNSAGLAMVGASSAEDVSGKSAYDLIAPADREAFRVFNERICSGEKGTLEFQLVGLDGNRRLMETHAAPLRQADGSFLQLAISRDVGARKHTERAALLLSAIVDSSDDAIISKNLDGVITSWNKSAERLFGYTADEAVGQSVATLLVPADRQEEEPDILARLRLGERVDHFETQRKRKDGGLLEVSLTISPVKDTRGNIVGASKVARDISERKRSEMALVESEVNLRQLADSMPQIVWTARPDGQIDYYNERWYEFTGFQRELFGDMSWEPVLHPDDLEPCRRQWGECVRTGKPYQIEYRFWDRTSNGWRWFMGRALPVRHEDGSIAKWYGSSTDIDQQKRVEEEFRRANQDLEQFAYSATHDLQEPLRTVRIYSELLQTRHAASLNAEGLEFLEFLSTGAARMERLVQDLLAYTQVGRLNEPPKPTDANAALAETMANLSGTISENDAQVSSDPLPQLRIEEAHLQQLFQNLIGNAIKYRSPDKPPSIYISAEKRDGHWTVSVQDNGIGIDPQYKESIFGLFKRLHTNDKYSGTGIGLAICQRIVERHSGRIWVESQLGQGSTFRFSLPL